jgi:hypothetical protein
VSGLGDRKVKRGILKYVLDRIEKEFFLWQRFGCCGLKLSEQKSLRGEHTSLAVFADSVHHITGFDT